jgi:hypothetical protein
LAHARVSSTAGRSRAVHEYRIALEQAYANAMRKLVRHFPDHPDAITLLADALMLLHGGANHLYIHVPEDSPHPQRALSRAESLHKLTPDRVRAT